MSADSSHHGPIRRLLHLAYVEFGLGSLHDTGRDAYLILLARTTRMFALGSTSLVLALFFAELQFSDFQIGLFMSLTLLGDVALTMLMTLLADRLGRRKTILIGSVLMICSGGDICLVRKLLAVASSSCCRGDKCERR